MSLKYSRKSTSLRARKMLTLSKLNYAVQIIYIIVLTCVKSSMLCFFMRVFITPGMQRASKIMLVLVVAWAVAYLCTCIFYCPPFPTKWSSDETCNDYGNMMLSLVGTNALGDLIIMALPMRSIWSLNTRRADKIGITVCFCLGLAYDPPPLFQYRRYSLIMPGKLHHMCYLPANLPCDHRERGLLRHDTHHDFPVHPRTQSRRSLCQHSDVEAVLSSIPEEKRQFEVAGGVRRAEHSVQPRDGLKRRQTKICR